jgi:hypothetical protein
VYSAEEDVNQYRDRVPLTSGIQVLYQAARGVDGRCPRMACSVHFKEPSRLTHLSDKRVASWKEDGFAANKQ